MTNTKHVNTVSTPNGHNITVSNIPTDKPDSFISVINGLIALTANVNATKSSIKRRVTIKPFNGQSATDIRTFFKTFGYAFSTLTDTIKTDVNGNKLRDADTGHYIRENTAPYFTLYVLGNLNKRTVQSISARINRKYRRITG